jgi:hypothetical protein
LTALPGKKDERLRIVKKVRPVRFDPDESLA